MWFFITNAILSYSKIYLIQMKKKSPNTSIFTDCVLQDWVNYFFSEPFESEVPIS